MQVDLTIDQVKRLIDSATDCTMIDSLKTALDEAQREEEDHDEEEYDDIDGRWKALDANLRYALVRWYTRSHSVTACFGDDGLRDDDRKALIELAEAGRFWFWSCVICNEECLHGEPKDWSNFQKVAGQDYKSYPGNPEVFTTEARVAMCDRCRNDYEVPEKCPPADIVMA